MSNKGKVTSEGSVAKDNQTVTDAFTRSPMETGAFNTSSSVLDPDTSYKMDNKRRGKALIFNQEKFYWRLDLPYRHGTNADRHKLEKSLKALNFDVEIYDDCKMMEVIDKIYEAAEADHSNADCFLLVFLSHGENDHVYVYDGKLSIRDITDRFKGNKCRSLAGKPKIFILQACRGDKHDSAVMACDAVDSESKSNEVVVDARGLYTLPAGADFIMCYSVAEGYFSHRNTYSGSWYIQDLCDLLQEYGDKLEFTELLTLVNRKVSMRSVGGTGVLFSIGPNEKKQVPCFASMLTKKLFFGGSK